MNIGLSHINPISDHRYLVAESPIWDDRRNCAFFVDIKGRLLCAYDPEAGAVHHWPVHEDIGFVALSTSNELLLGMKSGLHLFDPQTAAMRRLPGIDPAPDERLNDGKVAPDGSLWFGTMAMDATPGRGRLYRFPPGGTVELVDQGYTVPNGPAFGTPGYVLHCDTTANLILTLQDGPTGWVRLGQMEVPIDWGHPDGIEIDTEGRIWVGLWGGAGLLAIEPGDATSLYRIRLPATWVTSLAPIGKHADQLLITSASLPLTRGERRTEALDGAVFTARLDSPWPARSFRFGTS